MPEVKPKSPRSERIRALLPDELPPTGVDLPKVNLKGDYTIEEYYDLVRVIRLRRAELGLTCNELDDLAGVQTGYTAKIECWKREYEERKGKANAASPGRVLGALSLPLLFTALGLRLMVVNADPPSHYKQFAARDRLAGRENAGSAKENP